MGYVGIIDYGAGNLMSVKNSLLFLGCDCKVTEDIGVLSSADRLILPGVGAFPYAMHKLRESSLEAFIRDQVHLKPLLGICLGMQALFEKSFEISECPGLGLIPGEVHKIATDLPLPHIGWNSLEFNGNSPLLDGISNGSFVYFVHSFHAQPGDFPDMTASVQYGTAVCAAVQHGNAYGCQFHPEKSGDTGLRILRNFLELKTT